MNAMTPRRGAPHPDQAEHDAMARNRQGTPPAVRLAPAPDPMETEAFRLPGLHRRVERAKAAHVAALAVMAASRGKGAAGVNAARKRLRTAHQVLTRAQAALKAEMEGEAAAPAVQRIAIDGIREPRVEMAGKRAEIVTPLDRLLKRRTITPRQHAAGLRYRRAWEMAGMDAYPIGLGEGVGGTPCSGNRRVEDAVGAGYELDRLRAMLTGQGAHLVEHVVVHDLDVSGWAAARTSTGRRMDPQLAMGLLVGYLDVLGRE